MTLTWTPPTDDGGAEILGYIVEKCDADRKRWTKAHKEDLVTELTLTLNDLTEGKNYMFRVSAENAAGVGESSPATQPRKAKPPYGKYDIHLRSSTVYIYVSPALSVISYTMLLAKLVAFLCL